METGKRTDEYILCAAILFHDEQVRKHQPRNVKTGFVICGRRHHNCFMTNAILGPVKVKTTQGFITSKDRFVDRKEAGEIAFKAKQIDIPLLDNGERVILISEDLY